MAPNTAFRLIFSSLARGDLGIALDASLDLMVWIKRGGFIPEGLPRDAEKAFQALRTLRGAIRSLEETAI